MASTRPSATPIRAITTPPRSTAAPPHSPALRPPPSASHSQNHTSKTSGTAHLPFYFRSVLLYWLAWIDGVARLGVGRVISAALGFWLGSVVLVRKAYLTVTHTTAPSPFLLLRKSSRPAPAPQPQPRPPRAPLLALLALPPALVPLFVVLPVLKRVPGFLYSTLLRAFWLLGG
ncbi:hypothetical protein C8F04DRAFT_1398674 [Mycena alexandri]|uniref:Uncharacterized protein n=1 Tax=Mycena alexandri TaxID=1745969 RepID=A0AAD6SN90_9AGAR|nr:hypothetical protein C8F04DRAFT_1398674 [Mycena alexandri]